jgi:DNA-binding response OmpR family regulator
VTGALPPLINVAVVDDDPIIAAFVCTALERAGFSVAQCPTGAEAIPCIRAQRPQVVIMDLLMPEVDGVQLFLMLRRLRPKLPVIFCTAAPRRLQDMLPSYRGAGAVLLAKPFEIEELLTLVRQYVSVLPDGKT